MKYTTKTKQVYLAQGVQDEDFNSVYNITTKIKSTLSRKPSRKVTRKYMLNTEGD